VSQVHIRHGETSAVGATARCLWPRISPSACTSTVSPPLSAETEMLRHWSTWGPVDEGGAVITAHHLVFFIYGISAEWTDQNDSTALVQVPT
jgi:hypothetical protein